MATSISARNSLRVFRKTITFTGAAGAGAVGTVAVATMTGTIFVSELAAHCTVDLAGATATVELGVASDTAELIAQTIATTIDAGLNWTGATPDEGVATVVDKTVTGNLIITVGTANVTAGSIEICIYYKPMTVDGYLA